MAQKLLNKVLIVDRKEMSVIPEATHFIASGSEMKQFSVNPLLESYRMIEIPRGANTFRFEGFEFHGAYTAYGKVVFYGHRGQVLKTYNLINKDGE